MDNLATTVLKTENNKGIPTEFFLLFEKFRMLDLAVEFSENSTSIDTICREADHKKLVDEIVKLSTKYPKEVFMLSFNFMSYIETKQIYKVALGEITFIRFDINLIQNLKKAVEFPRECIPLINEALKRLCKLDTIQENGEVDFCPFKTTIHITDKNYKVVVEKHKQYYKVKKVFQKSDAVIWEKYKGDPFSDNIIELPF